MKILIADDEKLIRDVIKEYCNFEGYEVIEAENGIEALENINNTVDLIILDIMMPKLDGFSACKKIKEKYNIPIIMLSARSEEYDKLYGFDLGIDDYLTKPFSPKELIARIKAVTNRKENKKHKIFQYESLSVDFIAHKITINNEEVTVTPKEYELLCYFIDNINVALSREQLLSKVWGYDFYGDNRTVDTHIKMLRNNLKEYRNLIVTVRGMGYKFEIKEK